MKTIEKDLILTENTEYKESITVKGNITGKFNLKVAGNIDAGNIDAGNIVAWDIDAWDIDAENIDAENIDAWDIDAWDIDAGNIDAWDIDARNIDARNIICETRKKKEIDNKTICRVYIKGKSKIEKKEQE